MTAAMLNGYIGTTSNIHPYTALQAYKEGIVLWPDDGCVHWCFPETRAVFRVGELHVSQRMRRKLQQSRYTTTLDQRFEEVVWHCVHGPHRKGGVWLTREYRRLLYGLHTDGWAHSVEVWDENALAGGLIGLGIGHVFVAESMVSLKSSMSTLALVRLHETADFYGYKLIDCQQMSEHLARLGAVEMAAQDYRTLLGANSKKGRWATSGASGFRV